jgi:hypothetical protein
MKSISHIALVLCVFLVIASVDAIPDPPAVAPHSVDVKVSCLRDFAGSFRDEPLTRDLASNSHKNSPIHRLSPAIENEPKRSSDWIALAGYAADSSPPIS